MTRRMRPDLARGGRLLTLEMYIEARDTLLREDPDAQPLYEWSAQPRHRPQTPEVLAHEIIWIILCAGRSAQAARTIERKVLDAIGGGRPVAEVFGYRAKADAIERAWRERQSDFDALAQIPNNDLEQLLAWCHSIPFIGDDTQFQLGKNLGADLTKPDQWISRLAGFPDKPRVAVKIRWPACQRLCAELAAQTQENVATVDSMLWLACNKGVIRVGSDAGEPALNTACRPRRGSMLG